MSIDERMRARIEALPNEGMDLDNNHVGGILARHGVARELLCILRARSDWTQLEAVQLKAMADLVEKDIPTLLRSATQI